jgi:hypothetical protein
MCHLRRESPGDQHLLLHPPGLAPRALRHHARGPSELRL